MVIIDDQGRLFGIVNVVDALVVLLVAVIVVGGIAFVFAPEPDAAPEPETVERTAVLDLGVQPVYLASAIEAGDSYAPGDHSNVTITDVYVAPDRRRLPSDDYVPPDPDRARVLLALRLEGVRSDSVFTYDGGPLQLGRELAIHTSNYRVSGRLRGIGRDLERTETLVVVNATVSHETLEKVSVGDGYFVAGHKVMTVESVSAYATDNENQYRLFLGLSIQSVSTGSDPALGVPSIAEGERLTFISEDYAITSPVHRVGSSDLRGTPATRSAVLAIENVPPEIAEHVRPGATETVIGHTVAEVVSVRTEPADTRIVTRDGSVTLGPHPENVDLTVTADLAVKQTDSRVIFKGRTIKPGSVVYLGLENATVRARVVEL